MLSSRFPRNPNYPHEFSRKAAEFAVPWPDFVPGAEGESYKELSAQLPNRQGLKRADCSFWSKYIQALKDAGSSDLGAMNLGVVLSSVIQCLLISSVLASIACMEATRSLGTGCIASFHEVCTVQDSSSTKSLLFIWGRLGEVRVRLKERTLDRGEEGHGKVE